MKLLIPRPRLWIAPDDLSEGSGCNDACSREGTLEAHTQPEQSKVLVVFVKDPDRDPVKTRLAQTIGSVPAQTFYRHCLMVLSEQLGVIRQNGVKIILATTHSEPAPSLLEPFAPLAGAFTCLWQGEGNIGERLMSLDCKIREGGVDQRVCFVGSDAPTLPLSVINHAWDALHMDDFFLAPAEDGGFTLLACRGELPDLTEVRWSHSQTFADTWAQLERAGWSGSRGEAWYDVDEWTDMLRLAQELDLKTVRSTAEDELRNFLNSLASASEWHAGTRPAQKPES